MFAKRDFIWNIFAETKTNCLRRKVCEINKSELLFINVLGT